LCWGRCPHPLIRCPDRLGLHPTRRHVLAGRHPPGGRLSWREGLRTLPSERPGRPPSGPSPASHAPWRCGRPYGPGPWGRPPGRCFGSRGGPRRGRLTNSARVAKRRSKVEQDSSPGSLMLARSGFRARTNNRAPRGADGATTRVSFLGEEAGSFPRGGASGAGGRSLSRMRLTRETTTRSVDFVQADVDAADCGGHVGDEAATGQTSIPSNFD
jgi:hypothetical protein